MISGGVYLLLRPPNMGSQEMTFFLPEKGMPGENHSAQTEKVALPLFSVSGKKVSPVYYYSPLHVFLKEKKIKPEDIDFGLTDVPQLINLKKISPDFRPVITVSPHATHECFAELQILTKKNSAINSLNDLQGKQLTITERAMRFSNLMAQLLIDHKIVLNKLVLKSEMNSAKKNLLNEKIDALVIFVSKFSNGQIITRFGSHFEGAYENEPHIKVVHTTDTRLPCRIIFINSKFEPSFQSAFINHLVKLPDTPENYIALRQYAAIGKMTILKEDHWHSIKNLFKDKNAAVLFPQMAREVVEEK